MTTKIDVLRIKETAIPDTESGHGFFYTTSDTPYFKSGTKPSGGMSGIDQCTITLFYKK